MNNGSTRPLADRFWEKVKKSGANDCWLWIGATYPFGYGKICKGRRGAGEITAHRLSWILHYGDVTQGLLVLHRCDNPACVNPTHLWLGTQSDNIKDMVAKGRHWMHTHPERILRGDRHWMRTMQGGLR